MAATARSSTVSSVCGSFEAAKALDDSYTESVRDATVFAAVASAIALTRHQYI